jgi:hypothetical protein
MCASDENLEVDVVKSSSERPGGGIYTAGQFQIGHVAYRITKEGWKLRLVG